MKKIMAVDDSRTMLRIISNMLTYEGFEVVTASSAKEALDILSGGDKFNVIITEINMSEMDGVELTSLIRATSLHKDTPIIIVSTEKSGPKVDAGQEAGASGWLIKPFITDHLVSAVEDVAI